MFIALLVIAAIISYMTVGAFVARGHYAIEHRDWEFKHLEWQESKPVIETANEKVRRLQYELSSLTHKSYCYLNYSVLKSQGCNCETSQNKYHRLLREIEFAQPTVQPEPVEPSPSMNIVIVWPIVKTIDFIKGGSIKGYDPKYTAILEHKAGILN